MIMSKNYTGVKAPNTITLIFRSVMGLTVAVFFGIAGAFTARFFGLPNMLAAQSTIGVFGLAGGVSHFLLIRAAGGKVSWKQGLFLSIVWALSCIGGVTPLFFTLGTPLKMGMLAFYSFAIFGTIGGIITAFMMRSFFENAPSGDSMPYIVLWSFSFGIAAIAVDAIGEVLQMFLPMSIAWSIALFAMALTIGGGTGYSIVNFLRTGSDEGRVFEGPMTDYKASSKEKDKRYIIVLVLLSSPFYLNDFTNIYIRDWALWLWIDYTTTKLYPFLVVLWLIYSKKIQPHEFGITPQPLISFVTVFIIGTLAALFIDQNGYPILNRLPSYSSFESMPTIASPLWNWIDLTIGLLIGGILEELIFRGYLHSFILRYTQRTLIIIGVSAVAFGFIHWSGGLHKVIVTSAIGAVFMVLYLRTHSLPAIMLAHCTVNFIDFAHVIPTAIFRFP